MSDKEDDRDELDDDLLDEEEDMLDATVFKIRRSLGQPQARSFTTEELHSQIHESVIDLCPPYQRDVVWPVNKQVEIIDSIYHNFYVPPVIFAVVTGDDGEEVRICVDGKQRLTSIQKFIDGQIPYKDPDTKKLWYFTVSAAARGAKMEIPPAGKKLFFDKQITCIEYRGLTPAAERDVFQRVQLGMSLTSAEKLQAIASPRAHWICQLETKFIAADDGLPEKFEFDTKRGRNFQNLAFIAYCCDSLPEQTLPTAQKLERWLMSDAVPPEAFVVDVEGVLQTMWHIASERRLNAAFKDVKAKVAPVEFVFIGLMLYVMRGTDYTDEERAGAIHALRKSLRDEYKDIRLNTRVGRSCWELITRVEDGEPLDALMVRVAAQKGKRKKGAKDDEDEMDVDEGSASASASAKGRGRGRPRGSGKAKRTRTE
ncbi:hypothetical protein DENSPDRAFT_843892 [Dentipellis sp. KUC8613]|nr:hypothetical protein DENSPDRAFT_843892 [Dentipellis sp. KUC8613]